MIEDILTASRLRAGEGLTLEFNEFDLRARVRDVVDEFSINHPGRIRIETTGEIWGYWSTNGIRRVVENLVTNALKYGDQHSPVIISLVKGHDDVSLTVHNEGKPISNEENGILFEQFRRLNMTESKEGWGLGLMIAKGIVEAHGGSIHVLSSAGKGTDFIVSLPIRAAERKAS